MTFLNTTDYSPIMSGEIGRIESFRAAINRSKGYKLTLLGMRLSKIRVMIIKPMRTQKPLKNKPEWCFR